MNYRKLEQKLSRYFAVRGDVVLPADREVKNYLWKWRGKGILVTFRGCVFYEEIDLPVNAYQGRRRRGKHA